MKIVCGIDVGGVRSAAFVLGALPTGNIRDFCQQHSGEVVEVGRNRDDLQALADCHPDLVVLEPTGGYESIFLQYFKSRGIETRLAHTGRVAAFRADQGIAKTDRFDAIALSLYGAVKYDDPSAWLIPIELAEESDWIRQRNQLTRIRGGLVNRLRQRLAREWPEKQNLNCKRSWGGKTPGLIVWIAGGETLQSKRYQREYDDSIGAGVSNFTRNLARKIASLDEEIQEIESWLDNAFSGPQFRPYWNAINRFGFSRNLSYCWLTKIYPFERFLDESRKPIERKRQSRQGRTTTHHVSLSRFKATLGAGLIPNTSGTHGEINPSYRRGRGRRSEKKAPFRPTGDPLTRSSFFQWADRRVATGKLDAEYGPELIAFVRRQRDSGKNYWKAIANLQGFTARRLFRELCREIAGDSNS